MPAIMTARELLYLSDGEKVRRFDAMCKATFSHVDGRDLLAELHPRNTLDIKRRADANDTWFEGDWLTKLMTARDKQEE
jgi:hypothetical protein